jgi:hypothetical protein
MRASGEVSYGGPGWPDRRRLRSAPRARLWPGRRDCYPALYPSAWYAVYGAAPRDARYLWLRTAHGLIRVKRQDVELYAAEA